jgi:hypothetical protein
MFDLLSSLTWELGLQPFVWVYVMQYTLAMIGYGEEEKKTTVLELTYNYGVTEYTKGNAYAQVMSHELFRCFFAYMQGIILVSMHIC